MKQNKKPTAFETGGSVSQFWCGWGGAAEVASRMVGDTVERIFQCKKNGYGRWMMVGNCLCMIVSWFCRLWEFMVWSGKDLCIWSGKGSVILLVCLR